MRRLLTLALVGLLTLSFACAGISTGGSRLGRAGSLMEYLSSAVVNFLYDTSGTITEPADLTGAGSLTKAGTGTLTLTGNNSYTGNTTITAGTLQLGNGSTTGSLSPSSVIVNNGTFTISRNNTVAQGTDFSAGPITGTGTLSKISSGSLTLSGNNTYTGLTSITGGTLSVDTLADGGVASGIGASSNAAANLVFGTANLKYTGAASSTNRLMTLLSTSSATLDASGSGPINFTNTGAIAYGTANQVRTLALIGTNTGNNTLAATINNNGSGAVSLNKAWGNGALYQGTWVISGNNSYTGTTSIGNGVIVVTNLKNTNTNSNLGAGGTIALGLWNASGILKYVGTGDETNRPWDLPGQSTGGGIIDQSGSGLLKFTGNFTSSAASTSNKFLVLTGSTAGTGEIASAIVNRVGDASLTGIQKTGSGTWTLSGTNTYTGTTTVNGGTLVLTGSLSTGAVSVAGGTFSGPTTTGASATAAGAFTVSSNTTSIIRPGTFGNNTLNTGALTFSGGSARATFDSTTNTFSKINVTGNVALGGMGCIFPAGITTNGTYDLIVASGTMSGTLPSIITNSTGKTLVLSQVGNTLKVTVS